MTDLKIRLEALGELLKCLEKTSKKFDSKSQMTFLIIIQMLEAEMSKLKEELEREYGNGLQ